MKIQSLILLLPLVILTNGLYSQALRTKVDKLNYVNASITEYKRKTNFKATEFICRPRNPDTKKGFALFGFTSTCYMDISIPQNPAVGVYKIEGESLSSYAAFYYTTEGQRRSYKTGKCAYSFGQIEITEIVGKLIKGKFSFVASKFLSPCTPQNKFEVTGTFQTTFTN